MMLDVLVKATLVLGVAAAFSVLSRGRAAAATRHAVWVAGLVGAVLVPALSPALPTLRVPLLPAELMAAPPPSHGIDTAPAAWPDASTADALLPPLRSDAGPQAAALPDTTDTRAVWREVRDTVVGVPMLAWLWGAGAALLLVRLAAARLSVARLTRARVPGRAPWLALARRLSRRMRVARRLRFLRSDRVAMPMACGVVRPSVVLPAEADAWADDRLQAVLLHELAHVRRHDCLTQLVADTALAVLWFHPLAWVARRAIRRERERACDDLVLTAGTPAADYASHLLDVARDAQARTSSLMLAGGVAMARPSELEGRLMAILDDARPRRAVTPRRLAAVGSITLLVTAPLSALDLWRAPGMRMEATPASPIDRPAPWSSASEGSPAVGAAAHADAGTQEPMPAPTPSPTPTVAPAPPVVAATPADAPMAAARAAAAEAAGAAIAPLPPDVWYTPPAAHLVELHAEVAAEVAAAQAALAPAAPAPGQPGAKPGPVAPKAPAARREPVDPKVVAALTGALDDSDPEVRRQALHTLGRFRDPSAIDALVKALAHSDVEMRRHAAMALGQMRDPRASKALQGALKDTDVKVRQQALFALARTRDAAAFDPLVAALKDADPEIRQQAAFGLGQLRDARAVPALASVVGDANRDVRAQAVFALGQTRSGDAVGPLSGALKDSDVEIRRQAAFALGQIRDPRALDALMLAARDQDVAVRKQAFFALGQVGDGRAQDLAIAGLKDADPEVRRMAAFALARLADRDE